MKQELQVGIGQSLISTLLLPFAERQRIYKELLRMPKGEVGTVSGGYCGTYNRAGLRVV